MGATDRFVYDGWNLVAEVRDQMPEVGTNYYVWGLDLSGSLQGAGGIGGLIAAVQDGEAYFPCYDANGNVTELVNTNGASVAHYEYDPYGNLLTSVGTAVEDNPFRFSTKYLDQETGWYYYGYRYYSPELGRWLSREPIRERGFGTRYLSALSLHAAIHAYGNYALQVLPSLTKHPHQPTLGFHAYVFVMNSPLNFIDFLGLRECKCGETPTFHPGEYAVCYAMCWSGWFAGCLASMCGGCGTPLACAVCAAIVGPACSWMAGKLVCLCGVFGIFH